MNELHGQQPLLCVDCLVQGHRQPADTVAHGSAICQRHLSEALARLAEAVADLEEKTD
jgi:hypothetical protein